MIHFNIHLSCLIFQKDNTNEMKNYKWNIFKIVGEWWDADETRYEIEMKNIFHTKTFIYV